MSEDRLEKALEEMKREDVDPERLSGVRTRVWEKLDNSGFAACTEFQAEFRDYLEGRLAGNRRMLMEDHLSRCAGCRVQVAEMRGDRKVVAMPFRGDSRRPRWLAWAVAAVVVFGALYVGRDRLDTLLAPGGPRAAVAAVSGDLYQVPGGMMQSGTEIAEGEVIRTGPGARAVLRLADGSMVDVNERTELFINAAWSGQTVHLQRGDIIVQAAKQRRGHLRVQTRDSVASVRGTVFAVSAGLGGSVVSVVEGSVAVDRPGSETVLSPGEQAATNPALESSVQDAVSWSPDADTYITLLASFAKIENQMAQLPSPALRTQPRLLQYLPANPLMYGAVPNLGGTISQAMALAEQQSAENPTFQAWWNSTAGQDLRQIIERVQTVTPLMGDEIVYGLATSAPGEKEEIPMVLAEVLPGKYGELLSALEALRNQAGGLPMPFSLSDTLMVVSDSQAHLDWLLNHLGQGAGTPFAAAIAARYSRGAGWILGVNVAPAVSTMSGTTEAVLTGAGQMQHLFFEQRGIQGAEENEVTLSFNGPRMGLASWLAGNGSGGAAEYISSDAVFAAYASTREPQQLFDELTAQLARSEPSFSRDLAEADARLGAEFAGRLIAAFGTEQAFALEGLSASGPAWVLALLVNDPPTIDASVQKVADVVNAELAPEDQNKRITIEQETTDGRTWSTIKSAALPMSLTWTYDRGYLVASSDRATAARAIATRDGGAPLVWSPGFLQQLPSSAGLHPSAFAWLNTKGAFQSFASLVTNPALQQLLAERDPLLVVFDGTSEQIHASSRTRISGLIMDVMLLESLSRAPAGLSSTFR